ncbi:unnamed protein product, partial [Mesorhabditis spiculigera]
MSGGASRIDTILTKKAHPPFNPRRVLILSKITRYEFEKRFHSEVHEENQLKDLLNSRGSDYNRLLTKHQQHEAYVDKIKSELEKHKIEYRVVQRFDYDDEAVEWADAVMTAGGDGTFLLAASKIKSREKPLIGINTDPQGSEGYMCLMRKLPKERFGSALAQLLEGDFKWIWRQRIRISVTSDRALETPVELHDEQLRRTPSTTRWREERQTRESRIIRGRPSGRRDDSEKKSEMITQQLPVLALNEVFIGESLSSRVSYYELQIDSGKLVKQKSSGITICTGTGSTSWYFNINKLTEQCVKDLIGIIEEKSGVKIPRDKPTLIEDVCLRFNEQLIYDPEAQKLAFAIRDPIFNATFPTTKARGHADQIRVKSRGYDAHLVVDGGVSFHFNDGAEAVMSVHEEDALRTAVFR